MCSDVPHIRSILQLSSAQISLVRLPYVCTSPNILSDWKNESSTKKNSKIFDGVGMSYHIVCKYD